VAQEGIEHRKVRLKQILTLLDQEFPEPQIALLHRNPFELLIATILSAQCTDERVNKVTTKLFEEAPSPKSLAELPLKKIEKLIGSVNFFRNKSKNLKICAKQLVELHNGEVPSTREALVELAGVGRKTANVVLGNAFGKPSVVVDTHVKRLSNRLKFSRSSDPEHIEKDLETIVDKSRWIDFSHLLILHGRKYCKALRPQCEKCPIQSLCPSKIVRV